MKIKKIIGWVLATMPIWLFLGYAAYRDGGLNGIALTVGVLLMIAIWSYGIEIVMTDD